MIDPVLSWPAVKFRAVFRAALVAAATDDERPSLCAVQVRRENGVLQISATDGTWLFRWREVDGQTDEEGVITDRTPFNCVIPRRTLESFLDGTKKTLDLERANLHGEDQRWALETILDVCRHEFLRVPEGFPDVDKVVPDHVAPTVSSIGVGADMLARVAKAFALATVNKAATIFWQMSGDALSPMICTSPDTPELLAVVMPRRLEADATWWRKRDERDDRDVSSFRRAAAAAAREWSVN